mmetsp:Transcript_4143/g.17434  ORF Transcript_4143/g.17434 Transcript_4143/m.17434 type:complete len:219 (-) Transcript_4143:983-1639(-)
MARVPPQSAFAPGKRAAHPPGGTLASGPLAAGRHPSSRGEHRARTGRCRNMRLMNTSSCPGARNPPQMPVLELRSPMRTREPSSGTFVRIRSFIVSGPHTTGSHSCLEVARQLARASRIAAPHAQTLREPSSIPIRAPPPRSEDLQPALGLLLPFPAGAQPAEVRPRSGPDRSKQHPEFASSTATSLAPALSPPAAAAATPPGGASCIPISRISAPQP